MAWPTSATPVPTACCGPTAPPLQVRRAHHRDQPLRTSSRPRPQAPGRTSLARRLSRHPSQGRTQARSSRLPQARRKARPYARHRQGRRRLPATGRCREPCSSRAPWARMDRCRVGDRVSRPASASKHRRLPNPVWLLGSPRTGHPRISGIRAAMTATPSTTTLNSHQSPSLLILRFVRYMG
jgi:hypothetical protein